MSDPVWYRSLYWRIGLGFIACVAVLLAVQTLVFLWLANPAIGFPAGGSPGRFAALVAADLSSALESDPALDVASYVEDQFGRISQPLVVVMRDGRVTSTRGFGAPEPLVRAARARLRRAAGGRRGMPNRGRAPWSPIIAGAEMVGVVVAPGGERGALLTALREHGPVLAGVGVVLLLVSSVAMAFLVFRPAQRRLRALDRAAAALGAGDSSARAPDQGGDEVAALAGTFNRMAADLDDRVRELREADRVRRQLLADVSHELMTPLTAIRGYLETLGMPELTHRPEDRDRYLRIVMEETLRLEAIIGDLLDLARLEGGGTEIGREPVHVDLLFERVVGRHGAALAEHAVAIEARVSPGAEVVRGDARRLEQALQNLVANAVRHTPSGGRIILAAAPRDGRVRISVRDTGPGIPPEHLPRVFERFYKADTAREQDAAGSGLGLSIVKAIVERHDGTITAASPPDGGALFEIVLPGVRW